MSTPMGRRNEFDRSCAVVVPSTIAARDINSFVSRTSTVIAVLSSPFIFGACSLIELSGKMTRTTGEVMTEYSQKNDGVLGKAAGFGGKVNTTVGTTVEGCAPQVSVLQELPCLTLPRSIVHDRFPSNIRSIAG